MDPIKIGRFEIVSQMAAGAEGVLYKATDPKGGRTVAIRVMSLQDAGQPLLERFRQQAKAASVLNSPNIAGLLGGGEWEGGFFVVMEYVEGINLRTMLQEKRPPYEVLDLCRQVCSALDHAAAHGIVHPNLTPANIVAEWDGNLKILDYGVPKNEGASAASVRYSERLRYLSPEQVRGEALDRRSNLYSWGAILYEMIAGRPAFAADTAEELRRRIVEETPAPPQESNPAWNAGVSPVILKALSKAREERYASGGDLMRELESGSREKQPEPAPPAVVERKDRAPLRNGAAAAAPAAKPPAVAPPPPPPRPVVSVPVAALPATPVSSPASAAPAPAAAKEEPVSVPQAPPVAPAEPAAPVPAPAAAALTPGQGKPAPVRLIALVVLVAVALAGGLYLGRRSAKPAQPPAATAPPQTPVQTPVQPAQAATPAPTEAPAPADAAKGPARKRARAATPAPTPAPVVATGDVVVNSTPPGAQIQVDGRSDPAWVTPFTIPGLSAGQHTVAVAKAGYAPQSHTVQVPAGDKAIVAVTLVELPAIVAVAGEPAGAAIFVDGKDSGRVTPAQVAVPKGTHTIAVRKAGFFDATITAQLSVGQNFDFAPSLKPMGNVESLKTTGGIKKVFGGGAPKEMGSVQIKTHPKGASVTVNNRPLEKRTPLEFFLEPGNYEIAVTLEGYKPLRRMVTVQKDGKITIDEALEK